MAAALEGIKVLDLCHLAPGMYCTMILGDFGAEVLHVGRPEQLMVLPDEGESPWRFGRLLELCNRALNRNKKSIVMDLKSGEGRWVLHRLVKEADVLVEGFRPGVARRLGADYETLKGINPSLVYCSLSGFGQTGPYVELPGHDITYIAMGGILGMVGEPGGDPAIPMNIIADFAGAALNGVIGILLALYSRGRSGEGQYVDISYMDNVLALNTFFAFDYLNYGVEHTRGNSILNGGYPFYNVYRTRDRKYLAVGCFEPWFWENLCRLMGREDFIQHQMAEGEKKEEIFACLRRFFLRRDRDDWFEYFKDKNVPVGKVYELAELTSDPQLKHRGMFTEMELADGSREKTIGVGIKLSETPGEILHPAPNPGEHTVQILRELGYSLEAIDKLVRKGVIALNEARIPAI